MNFLDAVVVTSMEMLKEIAIELSAADCTDDDRRRLTKCRDRIEKDLAKAIEMQSAENSMAIRQGSAVKAALAKQEMH